MPAPTHLQCVSTTSFKSLTCTYQFSLPFHKHIPNTLKRENYPLSTLKTKKSHCRQKQESFDKNDHLFTCCHKCLTPFRINTPVSIQWHCRTRCHMTSYDVKVTCKMKTSLKTKYLFMAGFWCDFKFSMSNFIWAYRIWLWIMNLAYKIG